MPKTRSKTKRENAEAASTSTSSMSTSTSGHTTPHSFTTETAPILPREVSLAIYQEDHVESLRQETLCAEHFGISVQELRYIVAHQEEAALADECGMSVAEFRVLMGALKNTWKPGFQFDGEKELYESLGRFIDEMGQDNNTLSR